MTRHEKEMTFEAGNRRKAKMKRSKRMGLHT